MRRCDNATMRNPAMVQWRDSATVRQCAMVHWCNGATARRCDNAAMVQWRDSATGRQCAILHWCNGATTRRRDNAQWCNGATVQRGDTAQCTMVHWCNSTTARRRDNAQSCNGAMADCTCAAHMCICAPVQTRTPLQHCAIQSERLPNGCSKVATRAGKLPARARCERTPWSALSIANCTRAAHMCTCAPAQTRTPLQHCVIRSGRLPNGCSTIATRAGKRPARARCERTPWSALCIANCTRAAHMCTCALAQTRTPLQHCVM